MTWRILPKEEWAAKLDGTELGALVDGQPVWSQLPAGSIIHVVEDDAGAIAGHWAAVQVWHAEALWIADAHRKGPIVFRRLMRGLAAIGDYLNVRSFWTWSVSENVDGVILRHGGTFVPGRVYVIPARQEF